MSPAPAAAQARASVSAIVERVVEALELAGPGDQRQRPVVGERELADPHGHSPRPSVSSPFAAGS